MIDRVREELRAEQVYLVGHSRGTAVVNEYLARPRRAAKVAKAILLDGIDCRGQPMPCLALKLADFPGQGHVEVATSQESFRAQYEFLLGKPPDVVEILPQQDPVKIAGRAVEFPSNAGMAGATLQIWEVDPQSGARIGAKPHATFEIGEDGGWGPVVVDPEAHYEMALSGPVEMTEHIYMQPFIRSDSLVRLPSGRPDSPMVKNANTGDGHAALIVLRMREWTRKDVLQVEVDRPGASLPAIDVIPDWLNAKTISMSLHDAADSPGDSTLRQLPWFRTQLFQAGIDVFMPAARPPDGTIRVTSLPRGNADAPQVLSVNPLLRLRILSK